MKLKCIKCGQSRLASIYVPHSHVASTESSHIASVPAVRCDHVGDTVMASPILVKAVISTCVLVCILQRQLSPLSCIEHSLHCYALLLCGCAGHHNCTEHHCKRTDLAGCEHDAENTSESCNLLFREEACTVVIPYTHDVHERTQLHFKSAIAMVIRHCNQRPVVRAS
jgi:hypothetical protein